MTFPFYHIIDARDLIPDFCPRCKAPVCLTPQRLVCCDDPACIESFGGLPEDALKTIAAARAARGAS